MFEAYNLTFKTYIRMSFFHHSWNWHHCLSPIFNSYHFWTFPYELSTKNQLGHLVTCPWWFYPGAQVSPFDAAGVAALGTLPCCGGRLGSGSNRSQVRAGIRNTTFFGQVRELPLFGTPYPYSFLLVRIPPFWRYLKRNVWWWLGERWVALLANKDEGPWKTLRWWLMLEEITSNSDLTNFNLGESGYFIQTCGL